MGIPANEKQARQTQERPEEKCRDGGPIHDQHDSRRRPPGLNRCLGGGGGGNRFRNGGRGTRLGRSWSRLLLVQFGPRGKRFGVWPKRWGGFGNGLGRSEER